MRFLIGIDGGGTKTDFVLCDTAGRVISRVRKNGSNLNNIGFEKAIGIVKEGINELLKNRESQGY